MAKPKPEQQPASMPDQAGGNDAGAPPAAPPAGDAGQVIRAAEGAAVPAPGGASEEAGAEADSSAPVTDAAVMNAVQEELIDRLAADGGAGAYGGVPFMDRAVTAHYFDADGAFLGAITRASRGGDAMTPAELCAALGVDAAEVHAINIDTGTVVTRDGQKHRLA